MSKVNHNILELIDEFGLSRESGAFDGWRTTVMFVCRA
jgi:hypothetical protein